MDTFPSYMLSSERRLSDVILVSRWRSDFIHSSVTSKFCIKIQQLCIEPNSEAMVGFVDFSAGFEAVWGGGPVFVIFCC